MLTKCTKDTEKRMSIAAPHVCQASQRDLTPPFRFWCCVELACSVHMIRGAKTAYRCVACAPPIFPALYRIRHGAQFPAPLTLIQVALCSRRDLATSAKAYWFGMLSGFSYGEYIMMGIRRCFFHFCPHYGHKIHRSLSLNVEIIDGKRSSKRLGRFLVFPIVKSLR